SLAAACGGQGPHRRGQGRVRRRLRPFGAAAPSIAGAAVHRGGHAQGAGRYPRRRPRRAAVGLAGTPRANPRYNNAMSSSDLALESAVSRAELRTVYIALMMVIG